MKQTHGRLLAVALAVLVVENAWLAYPALRDLVLRVERSDISRGRDVARRTGCFNCHGPGGLGGVPNPGSQGGVVPAFNEQVPMMFVSSDADIRDYILDGAPAKKRQRESYRAEMAAQAIRMPAFRGWVSEREVDDLVAYIRSASELLAPTDTIAAHGAELVRKTGCFACHGEMGSGGLPNPGSLKGYIPGFVGADFAELVRSDEELRGWIRDGTLPRLKNSAPASFFLERQRIQMPAYRPVLSDPDIDAIAAYVRWLAQGNWRQQPLVRR